MITAPSGPTDPAAGVMVARPATIPEAAPKTLKEGVSKDEAAAIKKKFDEVGAKVTIS